MFPVSVPGPKQERRTRREEIERTWVGTRVVDTLVRPATRHPLFLLLFETGIPKIKPWAWNGMLHERNHTTQ